MVVGYTLLGSCWLILKAEGVLQKFSKKAASKLTWALAMMIAVISVWMLFKQESYMNRWFEYPHFLYLSPVPILVGILVLLLFYLIKSGKELAPFLCVVGLFFLCFFGLCISFYPQIVPPSIDIWSAASPESSLKFLLAGSSILIPTILLYSGYSYWVFRGKVRPEDHYH